MTLNGIAAVLLATALTAGAAGPRLDVPLIRQTPERCGPAALEMVMRYYGSGDPAVAEAKTAYSASLHGTLVTDLAAAARRAGFESRIARLETDSLVALLESGIPPIVLYQNGPGPVTVPHYAVVTAWNPAQARFTLNDGTERPRQMARGDLDRRWKRAGAQALIVLKVP